MDIQAIVVIIFFFIVSFVFLLIFREKYPTYYKGSAKKLPPGPWKLPIIGNLHNLLGSQPHHILRDLSEKYGPLMHLQLGQVSTVVVSSAKTAKQVMQTQDLSFAFRPRLLAVVVLAYDDMNIAFAPYGSYWKQMKRVAITEFLSANKVRSFSRVREEETRGLVDSIRSQSSSIDSPINLTEGIFKLMSSITFRAVCGNKCEDEDELISLVREASALTGGFALADLFPSVKFLQEMSVMRAKLEKIREKSHRIIQRIVDEHSERSSTKDEEEGDNERQSEDFVDALLRLQRSGDLEIPITTDHIKAVVCDIFAGGIHTSAATIEWALSEMIKNPRVIEKAQSEIRQTLNGKEKIHENDIDKLGYLKLVIKETLRLHPPAALLVPRECREACEIDGFTISDKTKVIVNAWAIGRDPRNWDDPESFYPERFAEGNNYSCDFQGSDFGYIPFGAGRRVCPGNLFAMAKIERALTELLYRFNWELPGKSKPQSLDMTETFGITVERKTNLRLIAIPFTGN